jgi:hypothetical protein
MRIGSGSTSESLKCVVCKKVTSNYDAISHCGLEMKIPVCTEHFGKINTDKSIGNLMSGIKTILLAEVTP